MSQKFVKKILLMITCNDLIVDSEPTLTGFGATVYLKYTKNPNSELFKNHCFCWHFLM